MELLCYMLYMHTYPIIPIHTHFIHMHTQLYTHTHTQIHVYLNWLQNCHWGSTRTVLLAPPFLWTPASQGSRDTRWENEA